MEFKHVFKSNDENIRKKAFNQLMDTFKIRLEEGKKDESDNLNYKQFDHSVFYVATWLEIL